MELRANYACARLLLCKVSETLLKIQISYRFYLIFNIIHNVDIMYITIGSTAIDLKIKKLAYSKAIGH